MNKIHCFFMLVSLALSSKNIRAQEIPNRLCDDLCSDLLHCSQQLCSERYENSTYIEERFTVTNPSELGYIVEVILKTVDRLGIDLKLAGITMSSPKSTGWSVEYGSAKGDHKGNYRYQSRERPKLNLQPRDTSHLWHDPSFTYVLKANVSFLGIRINFGPVHAFDADVSFQFTEAGEKIIIGGDALLPASEADALTFMTGIGIAKINALLVAGLKCKDICAKQICIQTHNYLPQTGLEVIKCNPKVKPIGQRDFGKGVEDYYDLGLYFIAKRVPQIGR